MVKAALTAIGEIGLSGAVRTVSHTAQCLYEAARLGFKGCLLPGSRRRDDEPAIEGIAAIPVRSVAEAVQKALA